MNALWQLGKWTGGALAVLWAGWVVTGLIDDTGPMGWMNALQQRLFGSYIGKLSFLVACIVFALLVSPFAVDAALRGGSAEPDAAPSATPGATRPRSWLRTVPIWLGAVALVWAAAIGAVAWQGRTQAADARADYPALRLQRGVGAGDAAPERAALQGRWLWDHTVQKTSGSGDATADIYVPIVAADWVEGDPVRFVARLTPFEARQQSRGRGDAANVRVKRGGSIPTPAFAVFERQRAPLAPTAVLVAVVPPPDASAAPPGLDWFEIKMWGGIGTGIVAFTALGVALMHRRARMDAAGR